MLICSRGSSKTAITLAALIKSQMNEKGYTCIEQWILSMPNPGEVALCLEQLGLYRPDEVLKGEHNDTLYR